MLGMVVAQERFCKSQMVVSYTVSARVLLRA